MWLGYLPLGLELVGRYLLEDPDLSVAEMLEELKQERLEYEAINPNLEELEATEITANLGVEAAFSLTGKKLDSKTKEVGKLLSLFNPTVIPWKYVESVSESLNWRKKDVNNAKKQLYKRHLIERLGEGEASYKIHPLIREFLQIIPKRRLIGKTWKIYAHSNSKQAEMILSGEDLRGDKSCRGDSRIAPTFNVMS